MAVEPLVSVAWLKERLDQSDSPLRVVHVSTDREFYDRAHIPGAVFSDLHVDLAKAGTRPETGTAHRDYILPTREEIAEALKTWGVGPGTRIVFYDGAGLNRHAARGFWLLRLYGYPADRVHLLDGGLTAWQAEGGPTTAETTAVDRTVATEPLTDADPALLATADDVLAWSHEASANGTGTATGIGTCGSPSPTRLLDVREVDEFLGTDVRSRRGGRIPGARHRFFNDFVGPDGRLRDRAQTLAILEGSGVNPGEVRATYCQGGIRAALAWFVLHEIAGLTEVRNYAGSWEEWGNRPELPIER